MSSAADTVQSSASSEPAVAGSNARAKNDKIHAAAATAHYATPKELALEFITELLGFVPINYIDDIINALTDAIYEGVTLLENSIHKHVSDGTLEISTERIEEGLASIESLFDSNCDKYFDRFELFVLRSILSVPESLLLAPAYPAADTHRRIADSAFDLPSSDNVAGDQPRLRLPLYDVYYNNAVGNTAEDERKLDGELEELRRKVLAAEYSRKCIERKIDAIYKRNVILEKFLLKMLKLNKLRSNRRKSSVLPSYANYETITSDDGNNEGTKKRRLLLNDPRLNFTEKESISTQLQYLLDEMAVTKQLADEIKQS